MSQAWYRPSDESTLFLKVRTEDTAQFRDLVKDMPLFVSTCGDREAGCNIPDLLIRVSMIDPEAPVDLMAPSLFDDIDLGIPGVPDKTESPEVAVDHGGVTSWDDFKVHGLLTFVNKFLRIYGWYLIEEVAPNGELLQCVPARVDPTVMAEPSFDVYSFSKACRELLKIMKEHDTEISGADGDPMFILPSRPLYDYEREVSIEEFKSSVMTQSGNNRR